jgi:prepilin-type N-terminal cleavage/methylation domain-containing protein
MTLDRPGQTGAGARRGFTLIEVTITVVLLAAAMTAIVQVLGWVAAERRATERRQWAIEEAANLMERVTAAPFEAITAESARAVTLSASIKEKLPGPELTLNVGGPEAVGEGKRVAIAIRWRGRGGTWEAPVRLAAWVYPGRNP